MCPTCRLLSVELNRTKTGRFSSFIVCLCTTGTDGSSQNGAYSDKPNPVPHALESQKRISNALLFPCARAGGAF